jgi:predicted transcriptional regulator
MTTVVKKKTPIAISPSVQRRAGLAPGDQVEVKVSPRTITITAVRPPAYKPTKAELAAIRKGEAAIARGESVPLSQFLHDLDSQRRKARPKTSCKVSR